MELSLPGEQQVPLCNGGLGLPVECSEQQSSSYGYLKQRRQLPACN